MLAQFIFAVARHVTSDGIAMDNRWQMTGSPWSIPDIRSQRSDLVSLSDEQRETVRFLTLGCLPEGHVRTLTADGDGIGCISGIDWPFSFK
jgi:hypothetical protein